MAGETIEGGMGFKQAYLYCKAMKHCTSAKCGNFPLIKQNKKTKTRKNELQHKILVTKTTKPIELLQVLGKRITGVTKEYKLFFNSECLANLKACLLSYNAGTFV